MPNRLEPISIRCFSEEPQVLIPPFVTALITPLSVPGRRVVAL
ncbi:hypothetical protein M2161_006854 [Streptomyces sp. SAI-133]|nr:hypothetical protein [Streptomyces sp. SAI-133]